jgi:hypothetical protein
MAITNLFLLKKSVPSLYSVSALAFGAEAGADQGREGSAGRDGSEGKEPEEQPALRAMNARRSEREANCEIELEGFCWLLGVKNMAAVISPGPSGL